MESTKTESGAFMRSLRGMLSKSSAKIIDGLSSIFSKPDSSVGATLNALEELLLSADLGVELTEMIMTSLQNKKLPYGDLEAAKSMIMDSIMSIIARDGAQTTPMIVGDNSSGPYIIMLCGMNGSGKTTTVSKLANMLKLSGHSVGVAACDTFRAAATEQLSSWSDRIGIPIFAGKPNADPASVAYSGCSQAKTSNLDFLLIDTAGRMHNKNNLMDELIKIERTIKKIEPAAPHKTVIVIDGNTGQNALKQVEAYTKSIKADGVIVTKLDGTSRGGVILSILTKYKLPIYYVCTGEKLEDIKEFNPSDFVKAILMID